jgi:hypothetical protein
VGWSTRLESAEEGSSGTVVRDSPEDAVKYDVSLPKLSFSFTVLADDSAVLIGDDKLC